mmetsp:Transcript_5165/g.14516  ORF Transcript_5165/g.14516 Transcript_5165/m.14516 type:complete len:232 (-) Transcript_5165:727-1422(-)
MCAGQSLPAMPPPRGRAGRLRAPAHRRLRVPTRCWRSPGHCTPSLARGLLWRCSPDTPSSPWIPLCDHSWTLVLGALRCPTLTSRAPAAGSRSSGCKTLGRASCKRAWPRRHQSRTHSVSLRPTRRWPDPATRRGSGHFGWTPPQHSTAQEPHHRHRGVRGVPPPRGHSTCTALTWWTRGMRTLHRALEPRAGHSRKSGLPELGVRGPRGSLRDPALRTVSELASHEQHGR